MPRVLPNSSLVFAAHARWTLLKRPTANTRPLFTSTPNTLVSLRHALPFLKLRQRFHVVKSCRRGKEVVAVADRLNLTLSLELFLMVYLVLFPNWIPTACPVAKCTGLFIRSDTWVGLTWIAFFHCGPVLLRLMDFFWPMCLGSEAKW